MIFTVEHTIEYRYSKKVFIEPMTLRLRPRENGSQSLDHYQLSLTPNPAGRSQCLDLEGNPAHYAWFSGMYDALTIQSSFTARTHLKNPFDFIITQSRYQSVPVQHDRLEGCPACYLRRIEPLGTVAVFADELHRQHGSDTFTFLTALNNAIHERCRKIIRLEGEPHSPSETLAKGQGACRDLAVLFVEACRYMGIPSRFVSGYVTGDEPERDMHAWAEIYLPGGGWRGYDPTNGVAAADHHLAVAASAYPKGAAPSDGSFRGDDASSEISYTVKIQTREQ